MKKFLKSLLFISIFALFSVTSASAMGDNVLKVGLRYGNSALFAANLENAEGEGYQFGWFDSSRAFCSLGETQETTITMIASGDIYMSESGVYSPNMPSGMHRVLGGYHVQLDGFRDFTTASTEARSLGGWPAYIDDRYVVRVGSYTSLNEAEREAQTMGGTVAASSNTGVMVTVTGTERILFEFDGGKSVSLGVMPKSWGGEPVTWFKGYRYKGGFEYARKSGGNLSVINVVNMEDYVKGVVPYEMSGSWPRAALEAQAVCARTFAAGCTKHLRTDGFDVCNSQHCQVYNGVNKATSNSDKAVDNTAGECLYYNGKLVPNAVYHSSNGGATEDGETIWGGKDGYLIGKKDPYESMTNIPNYAWSVTYTASELTWILEQKGENIGQVQNVYVSRYTPNGNVKEVTFEGSRNTLKVTGERCRTIFYSSTYNKSVRSQRFEINGGNGGSGVSGGGPGICVNDGKTQLKTLSGVSVLSGSGQVNVLKDNSAMAVTSSGTSVISGSAASPAAGKQSKSAADSFTITGTGNGHNVGLSQYGAKAMAEQGLNYCDILEFYYTDITIR